MFNLSPEDAMNEATEDIKECGKDLQQKCTLCERVSVDFVANYTKKQVCKFCAKEIAKALIHQMD